ncbi:hypothetical protein Q31b_20840 [Novipirellula aureliae]|uniref:Protein SlyX n=1 Tax=Novipirellula aureliae TaxID=2527966 RepID=A0A5C6E763_9BACT|nr:SlyX family protein [Novipirellula aureliae]TWU43049.1 hypothetical protein Q31b_20840 [Novipirellula aureliae]
MPTNPPHDSNVDDRLINFEMHIAHLQRVVDQLNEVVTEQAKRQDRMQNTINQLQNKIKEMKVEKETSSDPLDEKPPHY